MKDYLEALLAEVEEEEEEQTEQEAAFPLEEHLWWKKAAGMEERKAREEQVTPAPADMLGHRAAQEQAYPAAGETESGEREPLTSLHHCRRSTGVRQDGPPGSREMCARAGKRGI